ncbi:hypothetical protein PAMC26577_38895 [Caballeronia sordidicola]|uniref:Uncharacterized protein n=1 Tax=Caballeronia sordidicola TaxID=196367 RepID=A0A242M3H3_CABSO|nr:hypothetical protein PAMC26577_38895 [Caballeronia sordidicola]
MVSIMLAWLHVYTDTCTDLRITPVFASHDFNTFPPSRR